MWGLSCDSIDCVCLKMELPRGLRVRDWLGFNNMGDYLGEYLLLTDFVSTN